MEFGKAFDGSNQAVGRCRHGGCYGDYRIEISSLGNYALPHFVPAARPDAHPQGGPREEQLDEPRLVRRVRRIGLQQRLAHRGEKMPAAVAAGHEARLFQLGRRRFFGLGRRAFAERRLAIAFRRARQQQRHRPDQTMRRTFRAQRIHRNLEGDQKTSQPRVAAASFQHRGAALLPINSEVREMPADLPAALAASSSNRKRMAVERLQQGGQGGVGTVLSDPRYGGIAFALRQSRGSRRPPT